MPCTTSAVRNVTSAPKMSPGMSENMSPFFVIMSTTFWGVSFSSNWVSMFGRMTGFHNTTMYVATSASVTRSGTSQVGRSSRCSNRAFGEVNRATNRRGNGHGASSRVATGAGVVVTSMDPPRRRRTGTPKSRGRKVG